MAKYRTRELKDTKLGQALSDYLDEVYPDIKNDCVEATYRRDITGEQYLTLKLVVQPDDKEGTESVG